MLLRNEIRDSIEVWGAFGSFLKFLAYFINLFIFSKCTYLTDFLSVSYSNLNSKTLCSCRDNWLSSHTFLSKILILVKFSLAKFVFYLVYGDFTKDSVP